MTSLRLLLALSLIGSCIGIVDMSGGFMKLIQGYQIPVVSKLGQSCIPQEAHKACGNFACVNNTCSKCITDSQCGVESEVYVCNAAAGDCVLKPLQMTALTYNETVAGILAFIITSLAAVAGIGGGGMLVPLYILVVGFPPGLSVSMSQATILGCSGLNMLIKLTESHPDGGPLIDYNAVMILIPMTLSGTLLGHMIGKVLPDWLRLGLLILLLSYMLKRTMAKARKAAEADAKGEQDRGTAESLLKKKADALEGSSNYNNVIERRFKQFPVGKWLYCVVVWCSLVYLSYSRQNGIACGSSSYWAITAAMVASMVVLTALAGRYLKNEDESAQAAGYRMREDEIEWNADTTFRYPLISVTAGIGASLLGIGGGMILGILLFEMSNKIKPEVSAATAAVATALVASKASAEFYIYGELPIDYALYFIIIGCLGTCLGQGPIRLFIKANNKSSWIVYALAIIIAGSLVALTAVGIINVYSTWTNGGSMGFGSLCGKAE